MTSSVPHEFNRRATQYEQHAPVQRAAAAWLAEWLPPNIEGRGLELGAGTGFFTRHLVGRSRRIVASDTAPHMVQKGMEALPDAEWLVADAAAPPDGVYCWIFSCSLVQWLPDPLAAFRAWHRASAPGARLLAGWFVRGTMEEFFAACPGASPFIWRNPAEWTELLGLAGWKTSRQETKQFIRYHHDSTAMLREIHNAGAVIPRRIGIGRLRLSLRQYDRDHRTERGVGTTFEFLRVEAVRS